jgi:tRNA G18 (ribose-2'-O)-methylase SpoU
MREAGPERGALYGRHPVFELLRSGGRRADEVAVLAGGRGPLQEIVALARRGGVKVSFRTRDQLTAMAGSPDHQGVVARVARAEYVDLDTLLSVPAARGEPALLLALDQVQDPRNLGALLRTAEALGVHGVVIPKHHAVGLTDATARVAMGALEFVRVAREANLWGRPVRWGRAVGHGPHRCRVPGPRRRGGGAAASPGPDLRRPPHRAHDGAPRLSERGGGGGGPLL